MSRSKTRDSSGVTCWKCKEMGHFWNQCPKEDKQVNIARGSASDEDLFVCYAESSVDSWVMDSGASFHATHSSEALQNLLLGTLERQLDEHGHEVMFGNGQWKVVKGNLVMSRGRKSGSQYMVELPSEGVTVPVKTRNKVRFTESRGQKKVFYAREKPRATAKVLRRQWVQRTSIPAVEMSLEDFLLTMEIVCSQDVPGSGSACVQWEPVGTEDESGAVQAMTDGLKLRRVSTESSR
ncbi:unnamed protein product [Cuscuta campestris]|uniref:CCHC-type domain-containing protein n=1 Tax=Cuscuta campestris TaxID=132261 RepID=A0A484K8W6_9ASTE|nr:unnamed protein product [Cuscuta campestris]